MTSTTPIYGHNIYGNIWVWYLGVGLGFRLDDLRIALLHSTLSATGFK